VLAICETFLTRLMLYFPIWAVELAWPNVVWAWKPLLNGWFLDLSTLAELCCSRVFCLDDLEASLVGLELVLPVMGFGKKFIYVPVRWSRPLCSYSVDMPSRYSQYGFISFCILLDPMPSALSSSNYWNDCSLRNCAPPRAPTLVLPLLPAPSARLRY